ncbi:MAG: hypothetical protein WC624_01185 [Candidatus Margulisiibacteriota bacterium]
MSNYLLSFPPANAMVGRVSFSRSGTVDRKCLAPQLHAQQEAVPQTAIHQIISEHVRSHKQDVVLALNADSISAQGRDFLRQANILEDFNARCETVVYGSHLKRGNNHLRSFVVDEEESHIASPVLANKADTDVFNEEARVFLVSPEKTIFLNNYGINNSPKRDIHNIFDGNIGVVPLSGLEVFSALAYSLGYLKSGPELKERLRTSNSPRHELRAFYSALYAEQAMLDLQVNASSLSDGTLSLYSDPQGRALSSVEYIRTVLGTQLMPKTEQDLGAAFKLLNPADIKYLNKEEIERYKIFMGTRMVPV